MLLKHCEKNCFVVEVRQRLGLTLVLLLIHTTLGTALHSSQSSPHWTSSKEVKMDIELVSSLGPEEGSGSKNVACYSNKHDNTELQITPFNTKGEPGLKHNL